MASASTSASAPTWFSGLKRRWEDVSTTPGVNTQQFIEASESLVTLFDLLGSTAFSTVTKDMNGNIAKIKARFNEAPAESATLQDLVTAEVKAKPAKKATATEGLLWLLRGLDFTAQAIRHNADHKEEELATSFQESYNGTLKQYHNFVVKGLFSVALKATPYRSDFYKKLGGNPDEIEEFPPWLASLEKIVATLEGFYKDNNNFGY